MTFQSNTPLSITPQKYYDFRVSDMKNFTHPLKQPKNTLNKGQASSCSCFKSHKNHQFSYVSDPKFEKELNQSLKDQALKMSKQLAQKSFRHLKNGNISPKNLLLQNMTLQTTKQSFQICQKQQLSKNKVETNAKKQQKGLQNEKDEFDMSRITFSVVNRSYQKTVNNTGPQNRNSIFLQSNILSSMMSKDKEEGRNSRSLRQQHNESFSSISEVRKRGSGMGMRTQQTSKKRIKVLKTRTQIEPIKQENEDVEIKTFKFLRVKARDSSSTPQDTITKQIMKEKRTIRKIQTQERIQSSQSDEDQQNVKYDYSSVVIDFFNTDPEILEETNQNRPIEYILDQQDNYNPQTSETYSNNQRLSFPPETSLISKQASFSSLTSNNHAQSISNIRSTLSKSSMSFDSNVLSISINNNFNESSIQNTPKKDYRWTYKGYDGFDGLSCINQNQESEIEDKNSIYINQESHQQNYEQNDEQNQLVY